MRLITATEWIKRTFDPSSRPHLGTVKRWVLNEDVPGRIIGHKTYIDYDKYLEIQPKRIKALPKSLIPKGILSID